MKSYKEALDTAVKNAPSLDYPSVFISWAETVCDILCDIYDMDYEEVTEFLYSEVKEYQDFNED